MPRSTKSAALPLMVELLIVRRAGTALYPSMASMARKATPPPSPPATLEVMLTSSRATVSPMTRIAPPEESTGSPGTTLCPSVIVSPEMVTSMGVTAGLYT